MLPVVSSLFRVIWFTHQGRIVTTNQPTFYTSDSQTASSVPFVSKTIVSYENVDMDLLKYLVLKGNFLIPPPNISSPLVTQVHMISSSTFESHGSYDPWVVPTQ